jgi:type IX secretion system substrate protein
MMKKIVIVLSLICVATFGKTQRWQHIFGQPGTHESFRKITGLYDNGYLISAYYEENNGNWLIKTDINGNMLWEKFFVWDNSQIVSGTPLQDTTGSIIVAGSIWIDNIDNWPMINKIDSCGNPLWCRVFVDKDYDFAYFRDALILENQDILALAHHEETGSMDTNSAFLYYITSDGELLWKKPYGSKADHPLINEPSCEDIIEFNGEYYVSGDCYYAYPNNPNHVYLKAFCMAIDSLFNEKWILPFAMSDSIPGIMKSIVPLSDSVFMGAGIGWFPEGSGTLLYPNSYLMFFDKDGNELGYNHISNSNVGVDIQGNYIYDIARINDTLFLASSRFGEEIDSNPFGEFVIDTSGQIYKLQSRPNTFGSSDIIKTFDDKYVIGVGYHSNPEDQDFMLYKINENLEQDTVYTGTFTYDSLCSSGIESGTIDISDCLVVVGTRDIPTPKDYYASLASIPINAYPNPAIGSITFSLGNTENHCNIILYCYDTFGREVNKQQIYPMQTQASVDIAKWNSGMYVAMVTANGSTVGQCRFVVR